MIGVLVVIMIAVVEQRLAACGVGLDVVKNSVEALGGYSTAETGLPVR